MKTIVILGAGIGGIVAANQLRKGLHEGHRIILIEKNPVHSFAASFMWVLTGTRNKSGISTDLKNLLYKGIELIISEVQDINITENRIKTNQHEFNYDYLIIALGAELSPETIPGLENDTNTFYTIDGSVKLNEELQKFNQGNISLVVCSLPYKCPGAPHEGALLIADFFRKKGISDKITINFYTPEPQPMPVAGPELGKAVNQLLISKGINFNPSYKLISVDNEKKFLNFENKESVSYDLLVTIPPHCSPLVVRQSGLTNDAGWIPANSNTLETKFNDVYAIGDITAVSIPGRWKADVPMMLPKAGIFAHKQAEIVAKRIIDKILNNNKSDIFKGYGYCIIESGKSQAGFAYGNFYGEPHPTVEMKNVSKIWHFGKILFEKWWLSPTGYKQTFYKFLLKVGTKLLRIPIDI